MMVVNFFGKIRIIRDDEFILQSQILPLEKNRQFQINGAGAGLPKIKCEIEKNEISHSLLGMLGGLAQ